MQYSLGLSMFISYISGGFTAYGYERNDIVSNVYQVQVRSYASLESEKTENVEKWEIGEIIEWPVEKDNRTWIKIEYNNGVIWWVHDKLVSQDIYKNTLSFYDNYLITKKTTENLLVTQNEVSPNEVQWVDDSLFLDLFNIISNQEEPTNWWQQTQSIQNTSTSTTPSILNIPTLTNKSEQISFRNMPMITTVFSKERPESVFPTYVPRNSENTENNTTISMVAKIITRFLEERPETVFPTYVPRNSENSSEIQWNTIIQKVVSVFDSGIKHVSFGIPRN